MTPALPSDAPETDGGPPPSRTGAGGRNLLALFVLCPTLILLAVECRRDYASAESTGCRQHQPGPGEPVHQRHRRHA